MSFDFDYDKNLKDAFIGQSSLPDSPFEVADWSLKEAAPEPQWEKEAEDRIKRSDRVVVLLGINTHRAPGVLKEVAIARNNSIPMVQLKAQDIIATPVANAGEVIDWTWPNLHRFLG